MLAAQFHLAAFALAAALLGLALPAGNSVPAAKLLVVNQGDADLSIVDPLAAKQLATVPEQVAAQVGHEVAASPDGRLAYVPLYGDSGVGRPGTDGHILLVIDLATRKIVNRLDFGHGVRPHCPIYDKTRDLLYVTAELDQAIDIIDPHALRIVGSIPTHQPQSHMLALSHDGRRGYTANVGAGTVSVLDMQNRSFITTIPISANTQRIAISNDDRFVFTADQTQPRLAVIATATNKVDRWVALPSIGYGTATTPDGRYLLIALASASSMSVLDLKSFQILRTLPVGPHPQEIIVAPDGKTAYASNFGSDAVSVIDLSSWQVTHSIHVGAKADGMAWAAASR